MDITTVEGCATFMEVIGQFKDMVQDKHVLEPIKIEVLKI